MSSRIIRSASPKNDPPSIQWRQSGPETALASSIVSPRPNAAQPATDAEREKELTAAAYQKGLAAGEAAAAQKAQAKLDPALASFSAMVQELAGMRKKMQAGFEGAAVELAIAVARRVLHREIAADPEAVLGLVKAAFQKCDARETRRLRVSPQDAEIIRENQARLNFPAGLEIAADRGLPRGSAIFETSRGDLDASVDTQLAEIERGFADVIARRHA